MKNLILWTLAVWMLMGINISAQDIDSGGWVPGENKLIGEYEPIRDKISAMSNIQKLKEGALLVRLKTRQRTIDAFKDRGYLKMANQVEMKQKTRNQRLMNAFRKNFSFCEVYFFYSEDSEKMRSEMYEGIFLNENLEKDAGIVLNEDFILTAEVGNIIKDPVSVDASGNEYAATWGMSESLLVIKDANFEQLRRPFPYYVRAGDRFIDKKVAKLNKRLFAFAGIR
ncbi:MAG: hypothetical protein ACPG49_00970 [Chitinophagales bacterium]